jgi:hypothetical protein
MIIMGITHYTPTELLELYPDAKKIGWTPTKVGMMFRSGLLVGFISGKHNSAMILEESFIELMKYTNRVNRSRDINLG